MIVHKHECFPQPNMRKVSTTLALYGMFFSVLPLTVVPIVLKQEIRRKYRETMQLMARLRKPRQRKAWSEETKRFNDRMFLRCFRMERECFQELVLLVEDAVGESTFKSERYINTLEDEGTSTPRGKMYHAAKHNSGTYVSGEWKLGLTLRHLGGASYLDLFLWSNISPNYCRAIVRDVIEQWICNDDVIPNNF